MEFDGKIFTQNDYDEFLKKLQSFSKNETIEDHERHVKILNTKQKVVAVSMSNIRKMAKKIFKNGYEKFLEIGLLKNKDDEFIKILFLAR